MTSTDHGVRRRRTSSRVRRRFLQGDVVFLGPWSFSAPLLLRPAVSGHKVSTTSMRAA